MKQLLCIGCSNGSHFSEVFGRLMPAWQVHDLHSTAAGNRYITGRLIEWISNNGAPDRVYLQYSGLWRRDLSYDSQWSMPDYVYQTKTDWFNWIHSGGFYGSWLQHNDACKMFQHQHAVMDKDRPALAQQNLAEIATAIAVCDQLGVPMWWSTYYNYVHPLSDLIKDNDGFIRAWPKWLSHANHIEWSPMQHAHRMQRIPGDEIHFDDVVFEDWLVNHAPELIG